MRIPNDEGRIGVGMLARVALPAGEPYNATVVPKDAVILRGATRQVSKVNGDDTVDLVTVVTGQGTGTWVEVKSGLAPGTRVVTRGNERLQPGQAVRPEAGQYTLQLRQGKLRHQWFPSTPRVARHIYVRPKGED